MQRSKRADATNCRTDRGSRQTQSSGTSTIEIQANVPQLERRAHYAKKNPQHRKKVPRLALEGSRNRRRWPGQRADQRRRERHLTGDSPWRVSIAQKFGAPGPRQRSMPWPAPTRPPGTGPGRRSSRVAEGRRSLQATPRAASSPDACRETPPRPRGLRGSPAGQRSAPPCRR